MSGDPASPEREERLDAGLTAAFGAEVADSVLARLSPDGDLLRPVLLREEGEEPTPVARRREGTEGRYQIVGEIARGGVGVVLKGRDVDLGRDVAMKVIREEHAKNPEVTRRFVEEAQIGGQLQHPGIVPVYELGLGRDRRPYFTMKLIKGRTLATLLSEREDPSKDRRRYVSVFESVCQTMAYAHARGVIHRDLKPANVMVGAFGEVLVVDWGMGKVLGEGGVADERRQKRAEVPEMSVIATARSEGTGSHSVVGSVMGTPRYMSPEQARGDVERVDERSDVFALGAILCEILTGKPPYTGSESEVVAAAARAALDGALERLGSCGADPDLVAVATSCLAPAPMARPKDAGAVARAVASHLAAIEERARAAEREAAAARVKAEEERKRRRVTLGLAASVVAILLLAGGGWLWREGERRSREEAGRRRVAAAIEEAERAHGLASGASNDLARWREALGAARRAATEAGETADAETMAKARSILAEVEAKSAAAAETAARDEKDRRMVERLEDIRGEWVEVWDRQRAVAAFAEAYRDYGIDVESLPVDEAAGRIRESRIASALVAGLQTWRGRDLELARPVDTLERLIGTADPDPWRARVRTTTDVEALRTLAAEADFEKQAPESLILLVDRLGAAKDAGGAARLAGELQRRHPGLLFPNVVAGEWALRAKKPLQAVRYFSAALSLRPLSFSLWNSLGIALSEAGDPAGAVAAYREALRLRPNLVNAFVNLTDDLEKAGDVEGAIAAGREAVRRAPHLAIAHGNLAATLSKGGFSDEAIAESREAVRLDPKDASWRVNLCNELVAKDVSEALEHGREAVRLAPGFAGAHHALGRALATSGDLEAALAASREAVRLDPRMAIAHGLLGSTLRQKGDFEAAARSLREALRLDPLHADAHADLADTLRLSGDLPGALTAVQEAIRLKPARSKSHVTLGQIHWKRGDPSNAVTAYREAIRLDGRNAYAHMYLGMVLVLVDNPGAEAELREAIRIDPRLAEAHDGLAAVLQRRGDYDGAIAECREAVRLNPKLAEAWTDLGNALHMKGDLKGAEAAHREAIRVKPSYAGAYSNLGLVLAAGGDHEAAATVIRAAIRLEPDNAIAHLNLGQTLRFLGRFSEAADSFRRGHALGSKTPGWAHPSAKLLEDAERLAAAAERIPAVLAGTASPKDAREAVLMGNLCYQTRRYAAAVRLWGDGFRADPSLAENLASYDRYNAACAAALASEGKGTDAAGLDVAEQARLRMQAVEWLRADLEILDERLAAGDRAFVLPTLSHWRVDNELPAVRDEARLASLAPAEQDACRALWRDVDAVLARAR